MSGLRRSDLDLYPVRATDVDIYPVGVLAALQSVIHAPKEQRRWARRRLVREFRYIGRKLRERDFRAARMCLNGYLAEPRTSDVSWARCGHGWTRGRAWDDLQRHIAERHTVQRDDPR